MTQPMEKSATLTQEGTHSRPQPCGELASLYLPRSDTEHDRFLLVDVRFEHPAVQDQKDLHGGVTHTLVAIDERVTSHNREADDSSLLNQVWIKFCPVERGPWLGESRLQSPQIART